MHPHLKKAHMQAVALLACLALPWQAGAAPEPPPIRIGAISTLSGGPAGFAPAGLAAKAFFDSVNASGGIQKRKIVFMQEDDKGEPAAAALAARRLLDAGVVALAGNASLLECAVNADAYAEAGLASLPGLGLDGRCFAAPTIAPVNAGPYVQLALALRYASTHLQAERLCVLRMGTPVNVQKAFDGVVKDWAARTGRTPTLDERDIQYSDKPEDALRKAAQAGCQAVVFGGPEPFVLRYAAAAKGVLEPSVALVFLGSAYTKRVADELGMAGQRMYAMSEFEPWSSRSGSLSNWRNLMNQYKVPLTSSSQGGYVAAQVLVHVLRSIKGEITRESVHRALRQLNAERGRTDAPRGPRALHQRTQRRGQHAGRELSAQHALAADHADFHTGMAIDRRHERNGTRGREVDMPNRLARLAQDVGQTEMNRLAQGQQAQSFLARKQLDESILDVGHGAV